MIQLYSMNDLRKAIARKPFGWPRFEMGDFYHGHPVGIPPSERTRRRRMKEWLDHRHYYTASDTLAWVGGSVWTWQDSGGSFALSLANVSSAAARQGVKSSTTIVAPPNGGTNAVPPDFFAVNLVIEYAAAPTAGTTAEVYFSFSSSATAGTANPGNATGTDAAYTSLTALPQLAFAGALVNDSDVATTGDHRQSPMALKNNDPTNSPYMSPVAYNNGSGQVFRNSANTSILSVIPYWRQRAA